MTRPTKELVNAATKLTENNRLQIIEELLASLETKSNDNVDADWAAEVERRSIEIKQGTVRQLPWSEVKSPARERVYDSR